MCDKCVELDGKIEHYERVAASINDQLTIDRIKELVEQMKRPRFTQSRGKNGPSAI